MSIKKYPKQCNKFIVKYRPYWTSPNTLKLVKVPVEKSDRELFIEALSSIIDHGEKREFGVNYSNVHTLSPSQIVDKLIAKGFLYKESK